MSDTTGLAVLGAYRADIDAAIERFFRSVPALLGTEVSQYGEDALAQLEQYCLRPGKRLRGSLAALAYDSSLGVERDPIAIELAVILEVLQGYLLIIDDVMDRSVLRRGEPTIHEAYKQQGSKAHAADMIAINIGLLAQHLASLRLAQLEAPADVLLRVSAIMQRNIALTGFGQLDDVALPLGFSVEESQILRKYVLKSSYYTFVNPLQLGLALANKADIDQLQACERFGTAAGIAFQTHDDWLGIYGDSATVGKSNLDDIREGKFTIMIRYALEHADPAEVTMLQSILGRADADDSDLKTVQGILETSGAKQHSEEVVSEYATQAAQSLRDQPIGSADLSRLLNELLVYSITRKS